MKKNIKALRLILVLVGFVFVRRSIRILLSHNIGFLDFSGLFILIVAMVWVLVLIYLNKKRMNSKNENQPTDN